MSCVLGWLAQLQTPSLPSARGTRQSQPSTRQRLCRVPHSAKVSRQRSLDKDFVGKKFFAECQKSTLGKAFAECPDTRQSWNRKKPEKMGIFTQKNGKFVLIGGGPHRSAPIHLRLFSRQFHGYAADGTRTRDLPLRTNLLYHYTTLSLVSGFRFSS